MLTDNLGQCRYCGYEPIARTARFCPRCGGTSPYEADGFGWWGILIILLLAVLGAGGAYLYLVADVF